MHASPRSGAQAPSDGAAYGVMQTDSDFPVHLPLTMREAHLPDIPTVRALESTATATASATPNVEATVTVTATVTVSPTMPLQTATPTDVTPTVTDAPPTPTGTPIPELNCGEILQNGGFESGAVSWSVSVNGQQRPAADGIQQRSAAAIPPRTGDWVGWLGGLTQGLSILQSAGLLNYVPRDVVSATLQYHAAMITEETLNRRPNDWIRVRLDGERRNLLADGSARSEEDFSAQRTWMAVSVDVTQYLATDQVRRISLEVENDQERRTWFYIDDVSLRVCREAR